MIKRKSFVNVVLVYLLLFSSGALLFRVSDERNLVLIFILLLVVWALFTDRKINDRFVLYVSIFAGFQLVISLYTGGSLGLTSVIGSTMELVLAYFILKMVGRDFIDTYIKVIVILAGLSLLGYLSDQLNLFDSVIRKLPRVGNTGYEGIFYVFRYHYAGYDRNNSIFFEPGAYQGFLNAAIFMLFFADMKLGIARKWTYIILLLITLFTTFSTTGFLMFAGTLGLFLVKGRLLSVSGKVVLVALVLVSIVFLSAQYNKVLLEKIERYTSIQDITDSRDRRSFDALVDLEIIKKNWFGLGYGKYFEEFARIGVIADKHTGSSNGLTKTAAVYGIPFTLFLFGSYYWGLRKICGSSLESVVAFGMLLMFLVGESFYIMEPATFAIITSLFVYRRVEQIEDLSYNVDEVSRS